MAGSCPAEAHRMRPVAGLRWRVKRVRNCPPEASLINCSLRLARAEPMSEWRRASLRRTARLVAIKRAEAMPCPVTSPMTTPTLGEPSALMRLA